MMQLGIIRPSSNNWASLLHLVSKGNSPWRECGDYHALYTITRPDRYPIPHIHDITIILSKIPKTAITTFFGLFEFVRLLLGLCKAGQTFKRFINHVLHGLYFVCAYIDDVLVVSHLVEEHMNHLKIIFERFQKYGIIINPIKCTFSKTEVEFLGHHLGVDGISPSPTKTEAIIQFPVPTNMKSLRHFLGMLNFYCRFIPNCASILQLLTHLLSNSKNVI